VVEEVPAEREMGIRVHSRWERAAHQWDLLLGELGVGDLMVTTSNVDAITGAIEGLLAALRGNPSLPGAESLLHLLMSRLHEHEAAQMRMRQPDPVELLKHLMETNNLKQRDLAQELGGQSAVSAILNGHRPINAGQALRLAARFGIGVAAFIAEPREPDPSPAEDAHEVVTSNSGAFCSVSYQHSRFSASNAPVTYFRTGVHHDN
jgi:HTH-type transcriptional regulator/antitoxin HigA